MAAMRNTFELKNQCPFCGKECDLVSNTSGSRMPEDGDLSLCIGCGEFSIFDPAMATGLRKPNTLEYESIANNPHARLAREAWLKVKKAREKPAPPEEPPPQDELLEAAFDRLLTQVYTGTAIEALVERSPNAKKELRRIFFSGAMVVMRMLWDAHEDDETDTIVMGTLFDQLIDETNRFAESVAQKEK